MKKLISIFSLSLLPSALFSADLSTPPAERLELYRNLNQAIQDADVKSVERFLASDPSVVNVQNYTGWTLLMTAVSANSSLYTPIVKNLLAMGARVDTKNKSGNTALMIAAEKGYREGVELLLEHKADIHIKNNAGKTARDIAQEGRHNDIVQLLTREPEEETLMVKPAV